MLRLFFLCILFAGALSGAAPADSTTTPRTLWLEVSAPQGSDLADWMVLQSEQAFAAEPGFVVITRAERLRAAEKTALQPATRLANFDSLFRLERKPDFWVDLRLDPILASDGRAAWIFFTGERTVSAGADFSIRSGRNDMPDLQGRLVADTSWNLGYCGMLECENNPLNAVERLQVEKALIQRLIATLQNRMHQALTIPLREQSKK